MSSSQLTFIFFRGVGIPPTSCSFMPYFIRAHHWSWHVWGSSSRPSSGHFLSAAQMVTPTESGRKHARVDGKGRYLKFRNEARMAGAQLFHMAIGVYIWVFPMPRNIPFRNLKGHFLTAHTAQLYRTWISESSLTYVCWARQVPTFRLPFMGGQCLGESHWKCLRIAGSAWDGLGEMLRSWYNIHV